MHGFITYASRTMRATIQLARPGEGEFGALVPDDAPPPTLLREKQEKLSQFLDHRDEWGWLGADAKREPVDPGSLPRLSTRRKSDADAPDKSESKKDKQQRTTRDKQEREKKEREKREREKRERDERGGGGGSAKSQKPEQKPGVNKNQALWLTSKSSPKPELLVSGRVWDVQCLAKKFGTTVNAASAGSSSAARSLARTALRSAPARTRRATRRRRTPRTCLRAST